MNPPPQLPALPFPAMADELGSAPGAIASFAVDGDEIRTAFVARRIYPVALSSSIHKTAVELYGQWLDLIGASFRPPDDPWLPVGRVGPFIVLGHCDMNAPAPLPVGWFQPVLLQPPDYDRYLDVCSLRLCRPTRHDWNGDLAAPHRLFPEVKRKLIRPTTIRAALRLLLEYFPHLRADLERVRDILAGEGDDGLDPAGLPPGYLGACWALLERGGIADPTIVATPDALACRLTAPLAARVRLISEYAKNLWVGMERLPQPEVEDLLLNELGEGWHVHFLLLDGPRQIERSRPGEPPAPPGSRSDGESRGGGRMRVKIEDARTRTKRQEGLREPGVIRLSHKDVRELESYNARRPDRDPLKVFLKELSAGIRHGATDLHIEPGLESYRVRARIDGYLEEWLEMPLDFGKMAVGAAKEQFGMSPERWLPQDGACTVFHGSEVVNLRVGAFPIRGSGQKLAIRYLPRRGEVPSLQQLMPVREAALMRRAITRPYGLILLCGPTGSGKTTTTFSALSEINASDINITTMEDPVEYEMDGVNQAELDRPRGVDWNALLSGFLRQDPDVGMLGEIRDRETAETAIRLTLTGHIVFATLHTMSCAHTVERLVDAGVNAQMFANAATLIVSQRLVRRLCRTCRETGRRPPTSAETQLFDRNEIAVPAVVFEPRRVPCADCRNTGYKGQIAAFEMLPITEEVAQLIAEKRPVRAIEEWMRREGFPRVYKSALLLAARGDTSLAEANQWQAVWEEIPAVSAGIPAGLSR